MVFWSSFLSSTKKKQRRVGPSLTKLAKCKKCHYDTTPDRRQSKTILTIDEQGSKLDRNSVLDCLFLVIFDLRSTIVLTFSISAYHVWTRSTYRKPIKLRLFSFCIERPRKETD